MKRYLNRHEKEVALMVANMQQFLETQVDTWAKLNKSKALLRNARMASTYTLKTLKEMLDPLDADEVALLVKQLDSHVIAVLPNNKAIALAKKQETKADISSDELLVALGYATVQCVDCTEEKMRECELRALLMKQDIKAFDQWAIDIKCQYKGGNIDDTRD